MTRMIFLKMQHVIVGFMCFYIGYGLELYPYGKEVGDIKLNTSHNKITVLKLSKSMLLFSEPGEELHINVMGAIGVEKITSILKLPATRTVFLPYLIDIDFDKPGDIYYRETFDNHTLALASSDVRRYTRDNFTTTHAVIVTCIKIASRIAIGRYHSYQTILAYNGSSTYVILNYARLDTHGALVGYSETYCGWKQFRTPKLSRSLLKSSNIGKEGSHVYRLTSSCKVAKLYPYGLKEGDKKMARGYNYSEMLTLKRPFLFMSSYFQTIYVNVDGLITAEEPLKEKSPISFPSTHRVISLINKALDTRNTGAIYFRESFNETLLAKASQTVEASTGENFTGSHMVIISYINVPQYNEPSKVYTAQAILISNQTVSYAIYVARERYIIFTGYSGFSERYCNSELIYEAATSRWIDDQTLTRGEYVLLLTSEKCRIDARAQGFYPRMSNNLIQYDTVFEGQSFTLTKPMLLFSQKLRYVHVGASGSLLFNAADATNPNAYTHLCSYSPQVKIASLYHVEIFDDRILGEMSKDVTAHIKKTFRGTQAIIFTFLAMESISYRLKRNNDVQIILITNEIVTYVILTYGRVDNRFSCGNIIVEPYCSPPKVKTKYGNMKMNESSNTGIPGKHIYLATSRCSKPEMYPYGSSHGDIRVNPSTNKSIVLNQTMLLFSNMANKIYINSKGILTINATNSQMDSLITEEVLIAPYALDYNLAIGGDMFYRQTFSNKTLSLANTDISRLTLKDFNATQALVVTYKKISSYGKPLEKNTFQMILASSHNETYVILIYKELDTEDALTGFNEGYCNRKHFNKSLDSRTLFSTSNIGIGGKHVFLLTNGACRGNKVGLLPITNYGNFILKKVEKEDFNLARPMPFFKENATVLYTYVHGYISTVRVETLYALSTKERFSWLSGYGITINYKKGGHVFYKESFQQDILETTSIDVSLYLNESFDASHVFYVTYVDVPYFYDSNKVCTYQIVLASNGTATFGIFNYIRLDESFSIIGFSEPFCGSQVTTPPSKDFVDYTKTSNIGIPGKYVIALTRKCSFAELLPYGPENNDSKMPPGNDDVATLILAKPIILFDSEIDTLFISVNGFVTERYPVITPTVKLPTSHRIISPYNLDFDTTQGGQIFYRDTSNKTILDMVEQIFQRKYSNFKARHVVIITYRDIPLRTDPSKRHTFQLVIGFNGDVSRGLYNYVRLDASGATVGHSIGACKTTIYSSSQESKNMSKTSNTDVSGRHMFTLSEKSCSDKIELYPWGHSVGDIYSIPHKYHYLNESMLLFSKMSDRIFVSKFAIIIGSYFKGSGEIPKSYTYISPYKLFYNSKEELEPMGVYFRHTRDPGLLSRTNGDVKRLIKKDFHSTQAVVVSYIYMKYGGGDNTFQVVITSDGKETFAILTYKRLSRKNGLSLYSEPFCGSKNFAGTASSLSLRSTSNIGVKGRHVFSLTRKCYFADLYPYGPEHGDTEMKRGNEYYENVPLSRSLLFFSTETRNISIHVNGYITPYEINRTQFYIPTSQVVLAPYSIDLTTENEGHIYYREETSPELLRKIDDDIYLRYNNWKPDFALIITYVDVPSYAYPSRKNSFQVILAKDAYDSYAIFNYKKLEMNYATAGFANGYCKYSKFSDLKSSNGLVRESNCKTGGKFVKRLSSKFCPGRNGTELYSFGSRAGDFKLYKKEVLQFVLSQPMLLFTSKSWVLYVLENNYLLFQFDKRGTISVNRFDPLLEISFPHKYPILAIYHKSYDYKKYGTVNCREVFDKKTLSLISHDVNVYSKNNFTANHAVIVTYVNVVDYEGYTNTFQGVIVSDGNITYAVLKYERIDSEDGIVGFSEPFCSSYRLINKERSREIMIGSNTDQLGKYVLQLTTKCHSAALYPYGVSNGDIEIRKGHDIYAYLSLNQSMLLFSSPSKDIYISSNGIISIDDPVEGIIQNLIGDKTVIAVYSTKFDTTNEGSIFYREIFDKHSLDIISKDVNFFSNTGFAAKHAVIVSYINVPQQDAPSLKHTFQTAIASNGTDTYVVLKYIEIDTFDVYTGLSEQFCWFKDLKPADQDYGTLVDDTNANVKGQYILHVTDESCKAGSSGMYAYGASFGDAVMENNDNYAKGFALTKPMLLFSEHASKVWISTNGVVAVNGYVNQRKVKIPFEDTIIAPYNVDLDTRQGGAIYYRETFEKDILKKASEDIYRLRNKSVEINHCLIISFVNIPLHDVPQKKHTFQLVLASDGNNTYAVLTYRRLDSADAVVGFSERFCGWSTLTSPRTSTSLLTGTNIGIKGKHVYLLTNPNCSKMEFYPYGISSNDIEMQQGDNYAEELSLTKPMPLFSTNSSRLYISTNGLLSVNKSITSSITIPHHYTVIAPYHLDFDTTKGGSIFYRETYDKNIFKSINKVIAMYDSERYQFIATQAVIVTYVDVPHHDYPLNRSTFQVVLTTDGNVTYGIFNYKWLNRSHAVTGFCEPLCFYMTFQSLHEFEPGLSYYLERRSNIGIQGQFVFILTSDPCQERARWKYDAPTQLETTRLGYDFAELKWKHHKQAVDADIQKFPIRYIGMVTSEGEWLSTRYTFVSQYGRVSNLMQNRTYQIDLYTRRVGSYYLSGIFTSLEIKVIPYESVSNLQARQIKSEVQFQWITPLDLLRDVVVARINIKYVHKYKDQISDAMELISICDNQYVVNGSIGSIHSVEVTPVVDGSAGPSANDSHIVTKDDATISETNLIVIITSSIAGVIVLIFALMYAWNRRAKKRFRNLFLLTSTSTKFDPDKSILEQCNNLPYDKNFEFPRKRLTLVRVLGEGAFGEVYMATAEGMEGFKPRKRRRAASFLKKMVSRRKKKIIVAAKSLKGNATETEYKDLANELKLLIHLGEHRNIVNLLGACTKGDNLLVLLEYCSNGAMLNYLRLNRDDFEAVWVRQDDSNLTLYDLTWMSVQIADGMAFLAGKKCVHRDLAARNILLTEEKSVKISDFGLARDTDNKSFYLKESDGLLPIKWMAPEAIVDHKYTSKSDAWSFGILLWEIFTLGISPYPQIQTSSIIDYLRSGKRMEKPENCPEEIYDLMLQCWSAPPDLRPLFIDLRNKLDQALITHEESFFGGQTMARIYNFGNIEHSTLDVKEENTDKNQVELVGTDQLTARETKQFEDSQSSAKIDQDDSENLYMTFESNAKSSVRFAAEEEYVIFSEDGNAEGEGDLAFKDQQKPEQKMIGI